MIRQWELSRERRELDAERAGLREEQRKVAAWKTELAALRRKAETDKEKRQTLKHRVRWAREALTLEPPNVGLALRHLKAAEKA